MKIADRIARLGTETAFEVSARATAFAVEGKKVYPFHLGDLNFSTPANVIEAATKALKEGKTGYCPNHGIPQLREALAADINASHRTNYTMENVSIQPGGKPVIQKFFLTKMDPGDEVLYPNPGFPIYESQIEFNGGTAVPYRFIEGQDNFELDLDDMERRITSRTKLLVLNDLQNPTGAECSQMEFERMAELVLKHDLYVLCDEAYFDIRYDGQSSSFAALPEMADRCVILYTFSKKFAMTGWRLGAAVGPKEIIDIITKLNVNQESCPNHFIQYGALEGLIMGKEPLNQTLMILKERRDTAVEILNSIEGIHCYSPNATFYLFPNVTRAMASKGYTDYDAFAETILQKTGVSVCTRLHFGRVTEKEEHRYFRLAYSGIDVHEIKEGLTRFKAYIEEG